jgi:hypothetical protein
MLYNVLMRKYKFGQAHSIELLKGAVACCAQWPNNRVGLSLAARYSGESGVLAGDPMAASRRQCAIGELAGATGRTRGQGGWWRSSPEQWRGVEAVESFRQWRSSAGR